MSQVNKNKLRESMQKVYEKINIAWKKSINIWMLEQMQVVKGSEKKLCKKPLK